MQEIDPRLFLLVLTMATVGVLGLFSALFEFGLAKAWFG